MSADEAGAKELQLERAIKRVDSLKKHLKRKASNVKAEIHANISQKLECLRSREVSLLGQVDQVLQVKEATLHHQQAKLNQALGVLQTGLSVALDATSERQLTDTLEKLKRLELSPEETPYISFRANHASLQDAILNYGQVDGTGLPLLMAFDDPGNPSPSLPRCVEDYEDVDHHVFHKPLKEMKMGQIPTSCINVQIPKLSTRVEDWLQKKAPAVDSKIRPDSLPSKPLPQAKPNGSFTKDVNKISSSGSSNSLSNWLSLIKQDVDMEEEPQFEIVVAPETKPLVTRGTVPGGVAPADRKDLDKWLYQGSGGTKFSSPFLAQAPSDSRMWLQQSYQPGASLDDLKHKNFFQRVNREPSLWLCSQAYSKQHVTSQESQNGADFFSHISKDKDCWLQKQNEATESGKSDHMTIRNNDRCSDCKKTRVSETAGNWLSSCDVDKLASQLKDVCRANELCENISECVSQPDCLTLCFREKSSVKNVIDPAKAFKPLSLPVHEWLLPVTQKQKYCSADSQADKKANDLFHHVPDMEDSIWLMKPSLATTINQTPSPPAKFKDNKEETNLWLQKTSSANILESTSPKVKVVPGFTPMDFCPSDWLLVTPEDKERYEDKERHGVHDHDKESEGWSICSESHITTADQHAKDIAIASDYFNKWFF